jgi:hypothetical protein
MNDLNFKLQSMDERVLKSIKKRILPSAGAVLLKIFLIHISVALFTLSICPQLGVSTFHTGINLSHTFMHLGKVWCDFICGFFFTSTSITAALIILTRDEFRFIRFKKLSMAFIFILCSIGFLLMFNSKLFLELSLLWLIGTTFGVVSTIELGAYFFKRI